MMKNVKNIIKNKNLVSNRADTVNLAGGAAFTKSNTELLDQFAMTGTLGCSFYATAEENTQQALELLEKCSAEEIAPAIIKGRNEGFIRTFPILGLVELSKKDPIVFSVTFPQIIKTGNDLADFIDICRSSRGLGRSIKRAIKDWLSLNTTPYYAQKYRKQLADAIRLCRMPGDVDPIFGYILGKYAYSVKGWDDSKENAAYQKYPELFAHDAFCKAIAEGKTQEALGILERYRLDVDSLTAFYDRFDVFLWRKIAKLTPTMRFLKYLDKFNRSGVFANTDILKKKINVENLQKAKVFPFRLFTAWKNFCGGKVSDHLADVMDDYAEKYDWSSFNRFSWTICPDVSGSMNALCGSGLRFIDIAGMFTAFFRKGLDDCQVIPWSDRTFDWKVPRRDSVFSQMQVLQRMGGGTDMSCALRKMIAENIKTDFCVFITDTEEYGESWIDSWLKYRERVNPRAEAFILRSDSYITNPFPQDDAEKFGIHPIYGWNDNVIKFMEYTVSTK